MWSEKDLKAARLHHDAILAEFRKAHDSRDASVHRHFLQAGSELSGVQGVPSRSGYYIGWLAARAWAEKHPGKSHAELLTASADDIFSALR
jgi:hypothetical protein